MARGNGGDVVFVTGDDRKAFLHRLGQVCKSHGEKEAMRILREGGRRHGLSPPVIP